MPHEVCPAGLQHQALAHVQGLSPRPEWPSTAGNPSPPRVEQRARRGHLTALRTEAWRTLAVDARFATSEADHALITCRRCGASVTVAGRVRERRRTKRCIVPRATTRARDRGRHSAPVSWWPVLQKDRAPPGPPPCDPRTLPRGPRPAPRGCRPPRPPAACPAHDGSAWALRIRVPREVQRTSESMGKGARCPTTGATCCGPGRRAVQPFVGQHRPAGGRRVGGRRHRHAPQGRVQQRRRSLPVLKAWWQERPLWITCCKFGRLKYACRGARATAVRSATATKSALHRPCRRAAGHRAFRPQPARAVVRHRHLGRTWATVAPGQVACTRKTVYGLLDKWAVLAPPHASLESTRRADAQGKRPVRLRRG